MPRIEPLPYEQASPEARSAYDEHVAQRGRMTHMKRTLLHSLPAFHALMQWYSLRDAVLPFCGERLTTLFAHAISTETDCLICSTFFRRILIESGEDPDKLALAPREAAAVAFAQKLATAPNDVSDELYAELARHFTPPEIVALTAFGGLMVATNIVNNALRVDLDDYLEPYRRKPPAGLGHAAHEAKER